MLNRKWLIKMVRKWQKVAALGKRRIMLLKAHGGATSHACSSTVASRGHVFVYTTDGKRFMIPLMYLTTDIFEELLKMSEEEFGLPSNGPITLPCEAACVEYIISLIRSRVSKEMERAVVAFLAQSRCMTSSLHSQGINQPQPTLCGF